MAVFFFICFSSQRLRASPRRTLDPSRASIFVVGMPVFLSFLAGHAGGKACGGILQHYERMEALAVT